MFLKLSLTARPSTAQQFKAEAALLHSLREQGVRNVSKVLAREMGRLGVSLCPPPSWSTLTAEQELTGCARRVLHSLLDPSSSSAGHAGHS